MYTRPLQISPPGSRLSQHDRDLGNFRTRLRHLGSSARALPFQKNVRASDRVGIKSTELNTFPLPSLPRTPRILKSYSIDVSTVLINAVLHSLPLSNTSLSRVLYFLQLDSGLPFPLNNPSPELSKSIETVTIHVRLTSTVAHHSQPRFPYMALRFSLRVIPHDALIHYGAHYYPAPLFVSFLQGI